jgi:hypothetical protein
MPHYSYEWHDVPIEDPELTQIGFSKLSLPLNGGTQLVIKNLDHTKVVYCPFHKHDTVVKVLESLQEKLSQEQYIDENTAANLIAYIKSKLYDLQQDDSLPFFKIKSGRKDGGNGNGKGQAKKEARVTDVGNTSTKASEEQEERRQRLLATKIRTEDIQFVLDTMAKEAPYDVPSIKQLFFGMASAFTKCPIHHSVTSRKTGAGKTHDLTLVSGYFPKRYVVALAGMSDKALFHRHGINVIVDENTGNTIPIQPQVDELKSQIEELEHDGSKENKKENKRQIQRLKRELQELYDSSQKLILLDNTIFLFLDTAQEGLFNTLMSMISQDSEDQLYEFTDKSGMGKLGSKTNRLRGTPTIFTTQVIDDTRQVRYQEKNRLLIHVIPDTSTKKIHTAMHLIGQRYGLSDEEYESEVVNGDDKQRAHEILSIIVEKLIDHSRSFGPKKVGVKVPFAKSIAHGIHKEREVEEWAMTIMDRTMRYLAIITKVNMDSRPRIVDMETGKFYPISTFEDLKETLQLMRMASSIVRPYIANWYNNVFLPAFKALPGQPNKLTKEILNKDGEKEEITIMQENDIGLTSKELAQETYDVMKLPISSEKMREQYLYPLLNMGIINKTRSVINKSENLYSPVEDSIFSLFEEENDFRLKIPDYRLYPSKNVLEEGFRTIVKQAAREGVDQRYKVLNIDGSEITVDQIIDKYLSNPESCFIRGYTEFNNEK